MALGKLFEDKKTVQRLSIDFAGQAIDEDPKGDYVDYAEYERLERETAETIEELDNTMKGMDTLVDKLRSDIENQGVEIARLQEENAELRDTNLRLEENLFNG